MAGAMLGVCAAALARGDDDVFFLLGNQLAPRTFIAWVLENDWENGAHLKKIAEDSVEFGAFDKALLRYEAESRIGLLAPSSLANANLDAIVRIIADLSPVLAPPEQLDGDANLDRALRMREFREADLICCGSEVVWRDYELLFASGPAAPAIVTPFAPLPPGLTSAQRSATPARAPRIKPTLAIVATAAAQRNLDLVSRAVSLAAEQTPDVALEIYEDGAIQMSRADLDNRASLHPFVSAAGLRGALRGAHAVIDPAFGDPVGRWVREANALGIPAIAAVGGVAAESCDPFTTRRFAPSSADSLADAIVDLVRDAETTPSPFAHRWSPETARMAGERLLDAARRLGLS